MKVRELWHQGTSNQSGSLAGVRQECLTGSFPSSPQFRGGVLQLSWGKPGLEVKPHCPATASQAEGDHVTTSETSIRLHGAAGHPLLSEEARLVSNPHAMLLSNNSIWIPSAGQVYAKLPKKPNEVITPWIRLQNQEETQTAAAQLHKHQSELPYLQSCFLLLHLQEAGNQNRSSFLLDIFYSDSCSLFLLADFCGWNTSFECIIYLLQSQFKTIKQIKFQ